VSAARKPDLDADAQLRRQLEAAMAERSASLNAVAREAGVDIGNLGRAMRGKRGYGAMTGALQAWLAEGKAGERRSPAGGAVVLAAMLEAAAPAEGAVLLPWEKIATGDNPRTRFDAGAIERLADSIDAHGLLEPLVVNAAGADGRHPLIAGEQRLRAIGRLREEGRWAEDRPIPATLRPMAEQAAFVAALAENLARQDLHPLDEADAYRRLLAAGLTTGELAAQVGRTVRHVQSRARLAQRLSPTDRASLQLGAITLAQAEALAEIDDEGVRAELRGRCEAGLIRTEAELRQARADMEAPLRAAAPAPAEAEDAAGDEAPLPLDPGPPRPNQHGVYDTRHPAVERIVLATHAKAEAVGYLLQIELPVGGPAWIAAHSFECRTGTWNSTSSPMTAAETWPARLSALAALCESAAKWAVMQATRSDSGREQVTAGRSLFGQLEQRISAALRGELARQIRAAGVISPAGGMATPPAPDPAAVAARERRDAMSEARQAFRGRLAEALQRATPALLLRVLVHDAVCSAHRTILGLDLGNAGFYEDGEQAICDALAAAGTPLGEDDEIYEVASADWWRALGGLGEERLVELAVRLLTLGPHSGAVAGPALEELALALGLAVPPGLAEDAP